MRRTPLASGIVVALAASLALVACAATPTGAGSDAPQPPASADPAADLGTLPEAIPLGEVIGQGTVIDRGDGPELCLGAIAESYPPQCSGPAIDGWDWSTIDGWEESSGSRWGSYAVQGTFDGTRFAVTSPPIMLALYDPMPVSEEPLAPGTTDEAVLDEIQQLLWDPLGDRWLGSFPEDGRLELFVLYDDGSLQEHLDGVYGTDVVHVRSALVDVTR
ncbi:hypothetical protein [Agrococcus jejuensis]|uniref:Uncharacterized protein n=1 Tax=Agrococcus jejuensis TaxID=399736 RepID=A0A1G8GGM7_9MICO|nr:hypothetical protein [Agrococcus jejuensis]SDH93496.1 hypothetical protein SAMN04489720_2922 [Agrococcus jejuensis]